MSPLRRSTTLVAMLAVLAAGCGDRAGRRGARPRTGGDPQRGVDAIIARGCGACHSIPGVRGAHGRVAQPLTAFASRTYIAGGRTNTPENVIVWIMSPRSVDPHTAMPDLGLERPEARDIAAYLYTLE